MLPEHSVMENYGGSDAGVVEDEQLVPGEEHADADQRRVDVDALGAGQVEHVRWQVFEVYCRNLMFVRLGRQTTVRRT